MLMLRTRKKELEDAISDLDELGFLLLSLINILKVQEADNVAYRSDDLSIRKCKRAQWLIEKDADCSKRMEALKNNDVERYKGMLLKKQTSIPGDGAERNIVLSSILSKTEEYLHKLGSKIIVTKSQQEVEEAASVTAAAARAQAFPFYLCILYL
ncbi:hypothetical protein AgCh_021825 [Apium graveolens]